MLAFVHGAFITRTHFSQATFLPLVPPVLLQLVKAPTVSPADLKSVRVAFYGAAPATREIEMEWDKKFPRVRRKQGQSVAPPSVAASYRARYAIE